MFPGRIAAQSDRLRIFQYLVIGLGYVAAFSGARIPEQGA